MKTYISFNKTCKSVRGFKKSFIKHLNTQYRRVPDNIGQIQTRRNTFCHLCKKQHDTAQSIRVLGCGHTFHKRCIDNWLMDNGYHCYKCNKCQLT